MQLGKALFKEKSSLAYKAESGEALGLRQNRYQMTITGIVCFNCNSRPLGPLSTLPRQLSGSQMS